MPRLYQAAASPLFWHLRLHSFVVQMRRHALEQLVELRSTCRASPTTTATPTWWGAWSRSAWRRWRLWTVWRACRSSSNSWPPSPPNPLSRLRRQPFRERGEKLVRTSDWKSLSLRRAPASERDKGFRVRAALLLLHPTLRLTHIPELGQRLTGLERCKYSHCRSSPLVPVNVMVSSICGIHAAS